MKLVPIDQVSTAKSILWDLLAERSPEQSISHKGMPTPGEHNAFVDRALKDEYHAWYLIQADSKFVGSIYLTDRYEIGVSVFKAHQGHGYGPMAVRLLMDVFRHAPKFLANINPANEPSRKMFEKLGFKKIQETYSLEAE